jgi:hypothetical protein
MLVIHPAFNHIIDMLRRDPEGCFRPNKLLSGAAPCELVGDFISAFPGMSRDPVQPHDVLGRDIIERLLALLYQWRSLMCVCPCIVVICGEENQLDATHWFIELVICCTYFGNLYAHHQELETMFLVTICGA